MNRLLRGLRVIDPLAGLDAEEQDVRVEEGVITAIGPGLEAGRLSELDLGRPRGHASLVLCPGFIDLHAHLREPGDEEAETLASGARAAAAGGFTQLLAMANTRPPVDTPERVAEARARAAGLPVRVLPAAALTVGLEGGRLVDLPGCAAAGAAAFSDDGRNAAPVELLSQGLTAAGRLGRAVLVHPEDEALLDPEGGRNRPIGLSWPRPIEAELSAVGRAIAGLRESVGGRLHLQHLSAAASLLPLREARGQGLAVTAEATPHHLTMFAPLQPPPLPAALAKVNPPLRSAADAASLREALRAGTIDAIATDHAPHPAAAKAGGWDDAAPGMVGLETALAACLGAAEPPGEWLPLVVERLTAGPHRVLGAGSGLEEPRLRLGQPASWVIFDPQTEWTVHRGTLLSRSVNTPLLGSTLRGRVLLTVCAGRLAHGEAADLVAAGRALCG